MKHYEKEIVILSNNKRSQFVKLLSAHFLEMSILCRTVETKNELSLHLLTHKPDFLAIAKDFEKNEPNKIAKLIKNKYKIPVLFFNDIKDETLTELTDNINQLSFKKISQALPQSGDDVKQMAGSILANEVRTEGDDSYFNAFYKRLNLSNKKINKALPNTTVISYKDQKESGFLFIDSNTRAREDILLENLKNEINECYDCSAALLEHLNRKFIGSTKDKNPKNIYGVKCELPNLDFVEVDGKYEINIDLCSDKVKMLFDSYILLDSRNQDYLFIAKGDHLTQNKINKLHKKSKRLRIKKDSLENLKLYLNISHMINLN